MDNADSKRGTGDRIGIASRGSNRIVAISNDRELRLDARRVHKSWNELDHHTAKQALFGIENVLAREATGCAVHDLRHA